MVADLLCIEMRTKTTTIGKARVKFQNKDVKEKEKERKRAREWHKIEANSTISIKDLL